MNQSRTTSQQPKTTSQSYSKSGNCIILAELFNERLIDRILKPHKSCLAIAASCLRAWHTLREASYGQQVDDFIEDSLPNATPLQASVNQTKI